MATCTLAVLHTLGEDGPVPVREHPERLRMCATMCIYAMQQKNAWQLAYLHTPDQDGPVPVCERPGRLRMCATLRIYAMQHDAWQPVHLHTLGQWSSTSVWASRTPKDVCTIVRVNNAIGHMAICTLQTNMLPYQCAGILDA